MGGKIGGRSRSPRKRKAVLANLAKANAARAAKRRGRLLVAVSSMVPAVSFAGPAAYAGESRTVMRRGDEPLSTCRKS
jgi:hypothetical protein